MKKLWQGRFTGTTNTAVEQFLASIHFDKRLVEEDIVGSLAHVESLMAEGLISAEEAKLISAGLVTIKDELESGDFDPGPAYEDIHMYVESLLIEKIGSIGGKLHTGRSRNDQVALDMHLYMKKEIIAIDELLYDFQIELIRTAKDNMGIIMPGYTHLQRAQPVQYSHHILAYFWMFKRDRDRLQAVFQRTDIMPLGAGALAGSGFELNRELIATRLNFSELYENSMDAVSDRDYLLEFLSFASICIMHLSRLAEEIILWNSSEFGFIELDDAFTTGSSIMPQKKNPDIAELVRGKTGRIYGNLIGMLTTMKGLPLSYNKDMQEDKEGVFDTIDTLKPALILFKEMLATTVVDKSKMEQAVNDELALATDIADYLVTKRIPFREAHGIVGRMVKYCLEQGKQFSDLEQSELHEFHNSLEIEAVKHLLDPRNSVERRNIRGGTSTLAIEKQLEYAQKSLLKPITRSSGGA